MVKIKLENVTKVFDSDVVVLDEQNLEINDNEFMVLVGPSGCGKSTCLNLIAGLEFVTEGKVYFDDVDVTFLPPKERRVAMVFQSYALYPHMNVKENMGFALKLSGMDKESIKKRVKEAAELLGISRLLERKPKELSGGQRQRVALGRAIVRNPTAFLFDEPLSNLDAKLRIQMRGEIIKLHNKLETTQVYVTHDQVEAMSMADRIAILHDKKFQQIGTPSEVYNQPKNKFVAGFIGSPQMNFFNAKFDKDNNRIIFGENYLKISEENGQKISKANSNNVILGIRPEDIQITLNERENTYEIKTTVIEYLGAETLVTFEFSEEINGMASYSGFYQGKMGEKAYLSFEEEDIHVFDIETGINLIHYPIKKTN